MATGNPHPSSRPLAGPLGRKLLGWLLFLSLAPLFVSNTLGYVRSQGILTDLTERYLRALAGVEAQHVRSQVERYHLDLTAIAAGNEFLSAGALRLTGEAAGPMGPVADKAAVERHLTRKLDELRAFEALYLLGPDGQLLATTGPIPAAALEISAGGLGEESSSGLTQVPSTDGPLFRLLASVPGVDGEGVSSYLCALVSHEGLETFLEIPPHLAGSVESFILDARGRPLFVSHPHHPVNHAVPVAAPVIDSLPGVFARYENAEGIEVIGVSMGVPDMPWRYLAEAPVGSALGPLRTLRRTSFLVEILLSGLLILAAWLVVRGIVGPMGRLVQATRAVAKGDLSVRIGDTRGDEIGELGRAFDEMTGELEETRERVEELHARELERAGQLATVGELASGVAHEIKNPLVGISNGLDLVRRKVADGGPLEPIMDEMGRQLGRIEAAVRDLLAFARPAEPTLEMADLDAVVERAVRLVQPSAERAKVVVAFDSGSGMSRTSMDAELIGQAVVNLLINAVHASPEGARVTVRTSVGEETLEVVVEDQGRGISTAELDQIFKPFYTTRHNGTGLGLSITREIVERHGGRMEVESSVGEGSTFRMVLPHRSEPEPVSTAETTGTWT